MTQPLDAVRAALSTTPREREYLELDTSGWSDADKSAAAAELLDAARTGDWRVPAVLGTVMSAEDRREALEGLLETAPPRVRTEAGWELLRQFRYDIEDALEAALLGGQMDRHGMLRAADLLLQVGGEAFVVDLIDRSTREDVRTVLIQRLWEYRRFDVYPAVWWTGLGLLKSTLELPMASFRDPALGQFRQLLDLDPRLAGYAPEMPRPVPDPLRAAMDDVEQGQGPVPDAVLTPLSNDEEQALLVFAANTALNRNNPRGVVYVGHLGGEDHRDLIEWAAAHPVQAIAQVGADVLANLP